MLRIPLVCLALLTASCAGAPDAVERKPPFQHWIDGTDPAEPQTQLQRYDATTPIPSSSVSPSSPILKRRSSICCSDRTGRCCSTPARAA